MKFSKSLIAMVPTIVLVLSLLPSSSAHVPDFQGGGDSLETAAHIHDPLKSWVIYDELHESGEAHYFSVHMDKGQRLRLQFFSPDQDFFPDVAVMGPGIAENETLPAFVEVPSEVGILLIQGEKQERADFEPFTPASYYYFAKLDWEVTEHGDYIIAVFHADQEGKYGMAIGYIETFTLQEWLTVPVDTIAIHEWGGQNILLIIAPLTITFVIGLILLVWPPGTGRLTMKTEVWRIMGSFAGLLYVGGGFTLASQMAFALSKSGLDASSIVTLIFIAIPLILGSILLRKSINLEAKLAPKDRLVLVVLGLLGLFTWAGVIVGPVLSMIGAVLPSSLSVVAGKEGHPDESQTMEHD